MTAALIALETAASASRALVRKNSLRPDLWALLDSVVDPEIPALSIWEIGVLQDVEVRQGTVVVTLTPTYSGCPAMRDIEASIATTLHAAAFERVEVVRRLLPAWTSDWLSAEARWKLRREGISASSTIDDAVSCPQCGSNQVQLISAFSGTACKSLHRCPQCLEVFDHFKSTASGMPSHRHE